MMKTALAFGGLAALLSSCAAQAATGDVPFNGTIAGTCMFVDGTAGTLAIDPLNYQNLTSLAAPGTLKVIATSNGYNISMDTPTLVRPPEDTTPLSSIGGAYHATGATVVNRFNTDAPYALNQGTTNLNIFFFAGKTGMNIFHAGVYDAQITMRCE
ncbi:MAG: hypothetical protein KDJ74_07480 [Notoacmeibacter sp.]|nr:hypothetical protein [Notoacmeibacter sp.]